MHQCFESGASAVLGIVACYNKATAVVGGVLILADGKGDIPHWDGYEQWDLKITVRWIVHARPVTMLAIYHIFHAI